MYVYDEANNLAKAIQESKEYTDYKKAKEEVNQDIEMKKQIDEFERLRYDVQALSFQGKEDTEKMQKLQEMYKILNENKKIKEYFDVEVRFNIMLADINRIISESVKELI